MRKAIFTSHFFEDKQYIGNISDWRKDANFGIDKVVSETQHDEA